MPFDPDAYIASKSPSGSSGGFNPDAYLKSKVATPDTPQPPAPPERSTWQNIKDGLNIPRDVIARGALGAIAAPVGDIAGLAATGYEAVTKGGRGDGEMPGKFRDAVKRKITSFAPDNSLVSSAGREVAPVAQAASTVGGAVKDFAKGGAADDSLRGMGVNAAGEALIQAPGFIGIKGAPLVPRIAEKVRGGAATAARSEATSAARGVLGDVEATHAGTQASKLAEAQAYEDAAATTQRHLDAVRQRPGVPDQDALGKQMRDEYTGLMQQAKDARKAATDPLYAQAQQAAAAKEATGARVDIKPAVADIKRMLELSENLPDLQTKLLKLREAVEGSTPRTPVAPPVGKVVQAKVARVPAPPPVGLTYEQLSLANRYVKDIAFAGEAEGYSATIRNTAKKLSMDLDRQISAFVPEHDAAQAMYRKLSEPMETLGTKIGAALHDTEGGLKGEAYASVSAQDLPGRIFGKRERIDQLVDALAGGKDAPAEARAAAQGKVDKWVENWILDKNRDATPGLSAPGERAALNAAPGARESLARSAASEAAMERGIPELHAGAKASRAEAAAAEGAKVKVRAALAAGDAHIAVGDMKSALSEYQAALRQQIAVADPARYRAAIALIERADTLERKTRLAKRLAAGLAVATAGTIGGSALMKHGLAVPGAL